MDCSYVIPRQHWAMEATKIATPKNLWKRRYDSFVFSGTPGKTNMINPNATCEIIYWTFGELYTLVLLWMWYFIREYSTYYPINSSGNGAELAKKINNWNTLGTLVDITIYPELTNHACREEKTLYPFPQVSILLPPSVYTPFPKYLYSFPQVSIYIMWATPVDQRQRQ